MFSFRIISRIFLFIEFLLLLMPSAWGAALFAICFADGGMSGSSQESALGLLSCLLAFATFLAFWHLFFHAAREKFVAGKISTITASLAFTGFVLSIAAVILSELSIKSGIEIFGFGVLYVPTYLHLLFEMTRQSGEICPFLSLRNTDN
ncbi:MAG: hypothetical protein ABL933_09295 [Methyloglobulus sp.]|nr:hypothetical protein [Methyloglobulus sp.]